ncbi:hypothetical protein BDZ85DRAFT_316003 [Elsinoe ampelina]|uniref:Uncharacterized protein n=1 Tax=Elsinoe ampelina TaxID=302913 RepID=A0A6A6GLN5_9PEZI|nr:hypothetical protein BDZ85DRAFT_316003 [Elsinoe ampelina]
MPFATRTLRLSRPLTSSLRNTTPFTQRLPASIRLASSDYGSPTGGPISENPKDQGPNPSADKEHPGPPAPKVGQNTGTSGTKATSSGHNTPNSQSDVRPSVGNEPTQGKSEGGKKSFSTSARRRLAEAQESTQTKNGARPKILSESPPKDSEASEDVRRHNEEMDRRAERAAEGVKSEQAEGDKVPKGFWKGDVGEKKDGSV